MQNLQELRSDNADNILFNLSRNIVALQVETLFCAYYHVRDQLFWQQNTVLRQHVSQSSLKFYFLQQILVVLLVLPLKLQRVSQQICDWLSQSAATRPKKKKVADGEEEPEFELGQ